MQGISGHNKSIIKEAFYVADNEGKGYLNSFDLKVAIVCLFGYKPSSFEVEEIMSKVNKTNCPGVEMDLFMQLASSKIKAQDEDDQIRQMFRAFDIECRGFITLDNAKRIFSQVAPFMDSLNVEKVFREIDGDRDGRVSYKDFEFMMKFVVDDS
jgi:Ca2+-binding EF-hand superfamily protein